MPEQPNPPKGPQKVFMKGILDDTVKTPEEKVQELNQWLDQEGE